MEEVRVIKIIDIPSITIIDGGLLSVAVYVG